MFKTKLQRLLILFILATVNLTLAAQNITVSGTVMDTAENEPMIGATVMQKGSKANGVATDIDGKYTITVPSNATLVFSSVGYEPVEVKVDGRKTIDVDMKQTTTALDEVVVIGYGVLRKSDITGSISSISGKDVNDVPVSSALQALQGKAAGVNIIQNSGSPGGATTIKIRGTGTVNDADPLYVVDGFIVDNIEYLNPNDIANIEIFKDAASSAVYGARAANGVVSITTKGGEKGKVTVTFDAYAGFSNPWKTIDVMGLDDYLLLQDYKNNNNAYSEEGHLGMSKDADGNFVPDEKKLADIQQLRDWGCDNWWKAISRTGVKQQYAASVSGGTDATKFMVSASYYDEKGIVKGSDYRRFNARANISQKLSSWLTATVNMSYANDHRDLVPGGSGSVLKDALNVSPTTRVINERGYWDSSHPIARIDRYHRFTDRDRFDANMTLSADFLKFFNYQFKASYYITPETTKEFSEVGALEEDFGMTSLSTVYQTRPHTNKWEINNLLTFNWKNNTNSITVLAGQTAEGYKTSGHESTKKGTPSNDEDQWFLSSGYTGDKTYGVDRKWTAVGFIGRVNYSFMDRYLLQANVRVDGSSKFAKDNRWGTFPSVSLGWRFNSESFLRDQTWMTLGKLRVGWGKLGNNRIDELARYTYLTNMLNYPFGTGNHVLQPGTIGLTIGNDDIKWEKTETYNVGLDMAFLQNSISFSVEYFNKKTTDMLIAVPTVNSAGLTSSPMTNAGSVKNYGIETQATYRKSFGKFSFDVGFNLSWIKNEVTSLGTGNEPIWGSYINESSIVDYVTKTEVGRPIGSFYGYVTDGIFQTVEEVKQSAQYEAGKLDTWQNAYPGDVRFKDLNGDGKITAEDRTYLGSPLPDFVYGVPINLRYDGFELSAFFQGQAGNKIFNVMDYYLYNASNGNVCKDYASMHWSGQQSEERAWFPLNTNTNIPEARSSDPNRNFRASDFFVHDGSYCRLKELRLSYSFKPELIKRIGLSSLTLSATAYNLCTWTKYNGFDPEVGKLDGTEGNNLSMGVDHGNYPQARSFTFGLKFGI